MCHSLQNTPPQAGYSQQSSSNVVVVQQQAAAVPVIARPLGYQPDAGNAALMFALVVTIISLVCGCWWSIVCSIPGVVFANAVSRIQAICIMYCILNIAICDGVGSKECESLHHVL